MSKTHISILHVVAIVALLAAIQTEAGWFSTSTPKSIMEGKGKSIWFEWSCDTFDQNFCFKFLDGKILRQYTNPTTLQSSPWVQAGSYSFISKNTILVFWGEAKVAREIDVKITENENSVFMWWYTVETQTQPRKCWLLWTGEE